RGGAGADWRAVAESAGEEGAPGAPPRAAACSPPAAGSGSSMTRALVSRNPRLRALAAGGALLVGAAVAVNYYYARRPAKKAPDLSGPAPRLLVPPAPDTSNRVRAIAQYLEQHPRDRPARYQLPHLYLQSRGHARAMEEVRVLERDDPHDPEVYLRKAVVLRYDDQLKPAEREAARALKLKPDYDLAETLLGEIALDRSRSREALQIFE